MTDTTQVATEPGTLTVVPTPEPSVATVEPKPGRKTSEFALVVATFIAYGLTAIFHDDFAGYVPAIAVIVTGLSTVGYALSRAHVKKPVVSGIDPAVLVALTAAAGTFAEAAKEANAARDRSATTTVGTMTFPGTLTAGPPSPAQAAAEAEARPPRRKATPAQSAARAKRAARESGERKASKTTPRKRAAKR